MRELHRFLEGEGVRGVLATDDRGEGALFFAESTGEWEASQPLPPPTVAMPPEDYDRLARLAEKHVPARVRLDAGVSVSDKDEVPGGAKRNEIVMLEAHLDSWHAGTGATDNGAGSAAMIEAARILKALALPMARTVRLALWSGEEQGPAGGEPIGVGTAWETAARLTTDRDVASAEPAFVQPGLGPTPPVRQSIAAFAETDGTHLLAEADVAALAPDDHLWSLKLCKVEETWELPLPDPSGKHQGEGIVIAHPDTGYTQHTEIWADGAGAANRLLASLVPIREPLQPLQHHHHRDDARRDQTAPNVLEQVREGVVWEQVVAARLDRLTLALAAWIA